MSKMYEKIKQWYADGVWTRKMVLDAVAKGKITQRDANEILGEPYDAAPEEEDA